MIVQKITFVKNLENKSVFLNRNFNTKNHDKLKKTLKYTFLVYNQTTPYTLEFIHLFLMFLNR